MKVTIELTKEEERKILIPDHDWHKYDNPARCCHCELCDECSSILGKVRKAVEEEK